MQVIVHAESHTRDDGYYTRPTIDEALEVFFCDGDIYYLDGDQEEEVTKDDLKSSFEINRIVTFYNEEGEKITITKDGSVR